ncbi:unnamed protein product [Polarella glacialis]|uniref:Uncharacterized protein n=1 Tax=Polarella glacialis TaxID=89957 RepID=A0A813FNT8_POLGL|nr:unnamed protein product [Polarella glacialis]
MAGECHAGIFEILPSKLSWAPGKLEQSSLLEHGQRPSKQRVLSALELCSVSKPTESPESQGLAGSGGSYQVVHYSQEACGRAFGPLNLAALLPGKHVSQFWLSCKLIACWPSDRKAK